MALWLNVILAWVAVALSFLLIVIWILRPISKKRNIEWVKKLNRTLRKHHKVIGILLIIVALVHGLLSSESVLSFNWGTASWLVCVLLGLSWLLRKKLNFKKWWMYIHRVLTVAFIVLLLIHLISVEDIILDNLIAGSIEPPPTQTEQSTLAPKNEAIVQPTQKIQTPASAPTETPLDTPVYKDGVYEGTATGYRPGLVVEVVIDNGRIASVTVTDHNEKNEHFWGVPVERIPKLIVESQSTDVDTVSGATMTSKGIIDAVNDALTKSIQ